MNLLVIGASGMAGHMITYYLRNQGHQVATLCGSKPLDESSTLLNIMDISALNAYLATHSFDAIINCVGMLIKASELNPEKAILTNSYLPHHLEKLYTSSHIPIIHLSTDCVFSGKNGPYVETSVYDGELFYDRSKALGELKNTKDLTFRMSIIGPDWNESGIGLLNWFFKQEGYIYGYTNVYWNGITTLELAKAIDLALKVKLTGIYHLTSPAPISKYELLVLFKRYFDKDRLIILPKEVEPINKVLINTRQDFHFQVLPYESMLSELKDWIIHHPFLYKHYFPHIYID